jgi:hypothetical protein
MNSSEPALFSAEFTHVQVQTLLAVARPALAQTPEIEFFEAAAAAA